MNLFLIIDLLGLDTENLLWYQMFLRALIVFLVAIVFIRIAGMRSFGTESAFDVVLSITLGALLSRCITGHYPFFPTLATALFLALLHRLVAFLAFQSRIINKLVEGDRIPLYKQGKRLYKNLQRHSISEKDLEQAIHEETLENFDQVKTIWLE